MLKHRVVAALAVIAVAGYAGAGLASERCTEAPKSSWLTQDAVAAKLKEQGFEVLRTETKRSCYEVKARDAQGRRVELYVDPSNAQIVRESKDRS